MHQIHLRTVRQPTHLLIRELNARLGTTLVAYLANVRSRQQPNRWASDPGEPHHAKPGDEVRKRLQLAATVFTVIEENDDVTVARHWFIGANPRFNGRTPAERIREFDAAAVFSAAQAFVDGDRDD